jgi:hypothetical protein
MKDILDIVLSEGEQNKPKDPSQVTFYGRIKANKPIVPNLMFKNLLDGLIDKDPSQYNRSKETYSFDPTQQSLINKYLKLIHSEI